MSIGQRLLPEFDIEMANTRRVLERIPDGRADWRPHPKSGSMGWLAGHVAYLPQWALVALTQDGLDLEGMQPPPVPETAAELVALFDSNVKAAREAIAASSDENFSQDWTLRMGEKAFFTMPKIAVYRGVVMNHLIHHRAQLTLYLRLNDVAVPGLYGPSADEDMPFVDDAKASA